MQASARKARICVANIAGVGSFVYICEHIGCFAINAAEASLIEIVRISKLKLKISEVDGFGLADRTKLIVQDSYFFWARNMFAFEKDNRLTVTGLLYIVQINNSAAFFVVTA